MQLEAMLMSFLKDQRMYLTTFGKKIEEIRRITDCKKFRKMFCRKKRIKGAFQCKKV